MFSFLFQSGFPTKMHALLISPIRAVGRLVLSY